MYSVIIPTYNKPELLDLCLGSALKYQSLNNEFIVIIDCEVNFYNNYLNIINKYSSNTNVKFNSLDGNFGLPIATNIGVTLSSSEYILIVNDDNVFPPNWDIEFDKFKELLNNSIISPNQIESRLSLHAGFYIKDFGSNEKEFDINSYENFVLDYVPKLNNKIDDRGSTLPILMRKIDYLKVGGWNQMYPTTGLVADWDFFLKCSLNNFKFYRLYTTPFYHFCESTVNGNTRIEQDKVAHSIANRIWGNYIRHNISNNLKYI